MYITLAGDGPEFTNKLFNTIDIKPNSYICLNNLSLNKNEIITLGSATKLFVRVDDNNIYGMDIAEGTYDIYTLIDTINNTVANAVKAYKIFFSVETTPDDSQKIKIEYTTIPPQPNSNLLEDKYSDVVAANDNFDISMTRSPYRADGSATAVDRSGYAILKGVGANRLTESYTIEAALYDNVLYESNLQAMAIAPYIAAADGAYVTISGTPGANYASQTSADNKIAQAFGQAAYQGLGLTTPPNVQNLNTDALQNVNDSPNLRMEDGLVSFVAGGGNSPKDFILCTAAEDSSTTAEPVPVNVSNFLTGASDIFLWCRWKDPREGTTGHPQLAFGALEQQTATWRSFNSRNVPQEYEIAVANEGNLFNIDFPPQDIVAGSEIFGRYGPRVFCNTLSYAVGADTKTVICHWDMDVPAGSANFYDINDDIIASPEFNTTGSANGQYKYLWQNIGDGYNGNACSGHYWGCGLDSNYTGALTNRGIENGFAFQLRTGAGTIPFNLASGAFPATNTAPGLNRTAFSCGRSFQSSSTGYQNAYYALPNMFGAKAGRPNKGAMDTGDLEVFGTTIPATMTGAAETGSWAVSVCFRMDGSTPTDYQILFSYAGFRAGGTEPHALLSVLQNSSTAQVKISNGDPTVVENVNLTKISDGLAYTLPIQKWINIAVVFQSAAGPTLTPWLIVGVDEDGNEFKGVGSTCIGSPKKAIFGLGGNNACDGTQTVNTGFVGLLKFFKIQKMVGRPYNEGDSYDASTTAKLLCSDIIEALGDTQYFKYTEQARQIKLFDEDDTITGGFRGFGNAEHSKPLSLIAGQGIVNDKIACYNPYDTLFSNINYRLNFQPNLDNRVTQIIDSTGTDLLGRYLEGSPQGYIANGGGIIDDTGFNTVTRQLGFNQGLELGSAYVSVEQPPKLFATFEGDSPIDTEEGTNNNRIHINNLPIQSYNGKIGTMDRAIYQTTALLNNTRTFENSVYSCIDVPQKIYIPLHNAGSLHLNEFNVRITDIDNKLDPEIINSNMTIEIKSKEELLVTN